MFRWKYIFPRLAIVVVIVFAVWFGSQPILKYALIHSGQSMTGAKVEIDALDFDLWTGRVEMSDVQLADPRQPLANLVQAENAVIHVNPQRLLHREFIVDEASLSNIQFATPRTESGALKDEGESPHSPGQFLIEIVGNQAGQLGDSWFDQISDRVPVVLEKELESLAVVNELKQKWPSEYERLRNQCLNIQNQVKHFEAESRDLYDNPLRDLPRYQRLVEQLTQLRQRIENTRTKIHAMGDDFAKDRERLSSARIRDQNRIGQKIQDGELVDEQLVSQILLGDQTAQQLEDVLRWVRWFRDTVPDPEKDFRPIRARGFDVQFRQRPNLVFKKLNLDGQGRLGGQNIHFFGTASDVCTNPKLYDKPARIQLRGHANADIVFDATLDRRGPQKIDNFRINCPGLVMPATYLGNRSDIGVNLGESSLAVEMQINLIDDVISGDILLRQQGVQMQVADLNSSIGGERTRQILNQNLAGVNQFSTTVSLHGNVNRPQMRLNSDLGGTLVHSLDLAAREMVRSELQVQSERIASLVDNEISILNHDFSSNINEILSILDNQTPVVAELRQLIPKLDYLPKIR